MLEQGLGCGTDPPPLLQCEQIGRSLEHRNLALRQLPQARVSVDAVVVVCRLLVGLVSR